MAGKKKKRGRPPKVLTPAERKELRDAIRDTAIRHGLSTSEAQQLATRYGKSKKKAKEVKREIRQFKNYDVVKAVVGRKKDLDTVLQNSDEALEAYKRARLKEHKLNAKNLSGLTKSERDSLMDSVISKESFEKILAEKTKVRKLEKVDDDRKQAWYDTMKDYEKVSRGKKGNLAPQNRYIMRSLGDIAQMVRNHPTLQDENAKREQLRLDTNSNEPEDIVITSDHRLVRAVAYTAYIHGIPLNDAVDIVMASFDPTDVHNYYNSQDYHELIQNYFSN
jgi:hypothetical protein